MADRNPEITKKIKMTNGEIKRKEIPKILTAWTSDIFKRKPLVV